MGIKLKKQIIKSEKVSIAVPSGTLEQLKALRKAFEHGHYQWDLDDRLCHWLEMYIKGASNAMKELNVGGEFHTEPDEKLLTRNHSSNMNESREISSNNL